MTNDNKQEIAIAVIQTQVDAIFKKQDEIMDLMKDGFSSIRESYTRQISKLEVDAAQTRNNQREVCAEHKACIDDHCKRIRTLENSQTIISVKMAAIMIAGGIALNFIIAYINKILHL